MIKLGRNDACWCGSGKKYKSCHLNFDDKLESLRITGKKIPPRSFIKTPEQIEGIREAGRINTMVLDYIAPFVKAGISTGELDRKIYEYTKSIDAVPACLGYEGFPKSVCTSINNVVCHGIPSDDVILQEGDIINIDCTTMYKGYYGDSSRMFMIGKVDPKWEKLVIDTKKALDIGVEAAKPWATIGDVGYAINSFAKENGYSVVREIGGHGVGLEIHEDPYVSHIGMPGKDYVLAPGMTFTIEPMINLGGAEIFQDAEDGWTIYTADDSPSAQWEYTLLMTEQGIEILAK
jgi:methionyl aminopeptidase